MAYRLSLLDKSPVADGESPSQALAGTLELARRAEQWGFHRFWLAEHHNTPALASPAPEVLIAWILAHTHQLRVGSGGVMLQHYSPYKVAETFNLLASLAPGRVDLGVGKAPGGLPLSTRALQQGLHQSEKGDFAAQLAQLDHWLRPDDAAPQQDRLQATPLPSHPAQRFLLGASESSARLAASLGWQFVFATHLNGDIDEQTRALNAWHQESGGQRAILAVQVITTASAAEAERLASDRQYYRVHTPGGQSVTVASLEQAETWIRQSGEENCRIEPRSVSLIKGTAEQVHGQLDALQRRFNIGEFIIDTPVSDGNSRLTSLELLATHQLVSA
ncbi:LLM class flavin-dependent oxidoreductase [Pantoea sp. B65]|uniref:LLM class flavin-dependent oxidoreductase n=1 Tax=Pantoea sp. B65 TaxID=2813359 RepID=UPI0039B3ACC2